LAEPEAVVSGVGRRGPLRSGPERECAQAGQGGQVASAHGQPEGKCR
jgi:hypothetical protein